MGFRRRSCTKRFHKKKNKPAFHLHIAHSILLKKGRNESRLLLFFYLICMFTQRVNQVKNNLNYIEKEQDNSIRYFTHFMLESIITSKTRIKLLLKFFLNSNTTSYLRHLEAEFGENSNAIRTELNRLEKAGLLASNLQGNKKFYQANEKHPMFKDIQNIVFKHTHMDEILEKVIRKMGDLQCAFLTGDLARGKNSMVIDLLFIGNNIDRAYLSDLCDKTEKIINRRLRYVVVAENEMEIYLKNFPAALLLWKA